MLIQLVKTGLSTSSGVSTFSSDLELQGDPEIAKFSQNDSERKNEIDLDEVERFARCGAVGRQRANGAGSTGSELAACAAIAERKLRDGGNASNNGDARGKTQADGGAAQGESTGPHRPGREERPTDGR